jgi:2-methylcitrate dehydratase
MPCRITVTLHDGRVLVADKRDFEGFPRRPMRWATVVDKFERLAGPYTTKELRTRIVETVERIDTEPIAKLTELLARIRIPKTSPRGVRAARVRPGDRRRRRGKDHDDAHAAS